MMALDDRILDLGAKAVSLLRDTPHAQLAKKLDAKWRSAKGKQRERYRAALQHVVQGGVALPAALAVCGINLND